MKFRDKECISGATKRNTKVSGLITRCMDRVTLSGQTENSTLDSSRRTSATVRASSYGAMVASTKEDGTEENRPALAIILTSTAFAERVYGLMDAASAGLMKTRANSPNILRKWMALRCECIRVNKLTRDISH